MAPAGVRVRVWTTRSTALTRSCRRSPVSGWAASGRAWLTASMTKAPLLGHHRYTVVLPTPARAATPSMVSAR